MLNNEKSKIGSRPDGMTSSFFIIKQEKNDFLLTIHHVFGNQQDTIVIKMLADGKTRKVLSVLEGKLEWRKDGLHITLWKKNFLDKVTYKFGKDKNEFIADEVLVSDSDNIITSGFLIGKFQNSYTNCALTQPEIGADFCIVD